MHKLILPGSFDFDEPAVKPVRVSSRGLVGSDRRDFLKRASHRFVDVLAQTDLAPGEYPIHVIAIGTTEDYGPNRNGDGFTRHTCRTCHDTFVKHAKFFRNHQNKDHSKSYGRVIASDYNSAMHRIELLCGLNATKEAADRNGGLIADKELDDLEKGKDIPVSMACKVAFDVCSGCGNKARNRSEYCDEDSCPYGGLKRHMGKIAEDGHVLHADNPNPRFIDISRVFRQADRIAYVMGPLEKAASHWIGGAEAAELWGLSDSVDNANSDLFWLAKIAQARPTGRWINYTDMVDPPSGDYKSRHRMCELVRALAQQKVALCARDYLRLMGASEEDAESAAPLLEVAAVKTAGELLKRPDAAEILAANPYRAAKVIPRSGYRSWAYSVALRYGIDGSGYLDKQAALSAIRPRLSLPPLNSEKIGEATQKLAMQYVLFKVASLSAIADEDMAAAENIAVEPV